MKKVKLIQKIDEAIELQKQVDLLHDDIYTDQSLNYYRELVRLQATKSDVECDRMLFLREIVWPR